MEYIFGIWGAWFGYTVLYSIICCTVHSIRSLLLHVNQQQQQNFSFLWKKQKQNTQTWKFKSDFFVWSFSSLNSVLKCFSGITIMIFRKFCMFKDLDELQVSGCQTDVCLVGAGGEKVFIHLTMLFADHVQQQNPFYIILWLCWTNVNVKFNFCIFLLLVQALWFFILVKETYFSHLHFSHLTETLFKTH